MTQEDEYVSSTCGTNRSRSFQKVLDTPPLAKSFAGGKFKRPSFGKQGNWGQGNWGQVLNFFHPGSVPAGSLFRVQMNEAFFHFVDCVELIEHIEHIERIERIEHIEHIERSAVVRDNDDTGPFFVGYLGESFHRLPTSVAAKRSGWFVVQNDAGLVGQRTRDGDTQHPKSPTSGLI